MLKLYSKLKEVFKLKYVEYKWLKSDKIHFYVYNILSQELQINSKKGFTSTYY